jgi:HNH endonuclease
MVKTEHGWRFKHHLVAEEKLGRHLRPDERVSLKDKDKDNLDPDNIVVSTKGSSGVGKRRNTLERAKRRLEWEIKQRQNELARTMASLNDLNTKFGDTANPPVEEEEDWRDTSGNIA